MSSFKSFVAQFSGAKVNCWRCWPLKHVHSNDLLYLSHTFLVKWKIFSVLSIRIRCNDIFVSLEFAYLILINLWLNCICWSKYANRLRRMRNWINKNWHFVLYLEAHLTLFAKFCAAKILFSICEYRVHCTKWVGPCLSSWCVLTNRKYTFTVQLLNKRQYVSNVHSIVKISQANRWHCFCLYSMFLTIVRMYVYFISISSDFMCRYGLHRFYPAIQ